MSTRQQGETDPDGLASGQGLGQGLAPGSGLACRGTRSPKRRRRNIVYEADDEGSVDGCIGDDNAAAVVCTTSPSITPLAHIHPTTAMTSGPGLEQKSWPAQKPGLVLGGKAFVHPSPFARHVCLNGEYHG